MSRRTLVAAGVMVVFALAAALVAADRSREVAVRVLDTATQQGIEGAVVGLLSDGGLERLECRTGPRGEGRCEVPQGRSFAVETSAPGYHRAEARLAAEQDQLVVLLRPLATAPLEKEASESEAAVGPVRPSWVFDEQGRPIAGATASLGAVTLDELANPQLGPIPVMRLAETKTDAQGQYRLEPREWPRASIVVLTLSAEGYEPFSEVVPSVQALEDRRDRLLPGGRWLEVEVVDGATQQPIPSATASCRIGSAGALLRFDPEMARPWRFRTSTQQPVTCSGWAPGYRMLHHVNESRRGDGERLTLELYRISGAFLGTVRSAEEGLPLPGVRVEVHTEGGLASGVTDKEGGYRLGPELAMTGRILLRVSRPGHEAALQLTDTALEQSGGEFKVMREADHIRVDVLLDNASSLCGTVKSSRGQPVGEASVVATSAAGVVPPLIRTASTKPDGTFCLPVRSMGRYMLEVRHPEYSPRLMPGIEVGRDGAQVEVVLHDRVQLSGIVLSPKGTPVKGAMVNATHAELRLGLHAFSAADGTFVIDAVPPGPYIVAGAHTPHSLTGPEVRVEVNSGMDRTGVVVHTLGQGSFSGRVRFGSTEAPDLFVWYNGVGKSREALVPVKDGRYVVEGLAPGEYQVWVAAKGYGRAGPVTVEVSDGQDKTGVDWDFAKGFRLVGQVREADTKEPILGATVEFFRIADDPSSPASKVSENLRAGLTMTNAEGRFVLEALPKGQYLLLAKANRFAPETALVPLLGAGGSSEVVLELGGGGLMVIKATGWDGGPARGALCMIEREEHGDMGQNMQTDPDGVCLFESLAPGDYMAEVHYRPSSEASNEGRVVSARVRVTAGRASTLELNPESGRAQPVR